MKFLSSIDPLDVTQLWWKFVLRLASFASHLCVPFPSRRSLWVSVIRAPAQTRTPPRAREATEGRSGEMKGFRLSSFLPQKERTAKDARQDYGTTLTCRCQRAASRERAAKLGLGSSRVDVPAAQ